MGVNPQPADPERLFTNCKVLVEGKLALCENGTNPAALHLGISNETTLSDLGNGVECYESHDKVNGRRHYAVCVSDTKLKPFAQALVSFETSPWR